MDILMVSIKVKPEMVDGFRTATLENVRESVKEPGIGRFELLQDPDDRTRFVLIEGYLDAEAPARHKATAHYLRWKEIAEPMMAEPRTRAMFRLVKPV